MKQPFAISWVFEILIFNHQDIAGSSYPLYVFSTQIVFKTRIPQQPISLRVSMEFERRAESRNTATRKRAGTKARDIMKQYPKEKAEALIKKLKGKGMYYFDPDFENDQEDPKGLYFQLPKCWISTPQQ